VSTIAQRAEVLELFSAESDEALFLDSDVVAKRYTAKQAEAIDFKREAIVMLVAAGWPTETIASRLGVSTRTVGALMARNAEKVAGDKKTFGKMLHNFSAHWFGLARAKEHTAKFTDLVIAAGIAAQRGTELLQTGEVVEENVLQIDGDRSETRDKVLQMLRDEAGVDSASPLPNANGVDSTRVVDVESVSGAGGDAGGDAGDRSAAHQATEGRGGGSMADRPAQMAMPQAEGGFSAKRFNESETKGGADDASA
jgi:hypothetical protein